MMNINLILGEIEYMFNLSFIYIYFSPEIQKNLAKKCFQLIGKKVKNRRMADFNDIMKSRLPEDFE